MKIIPAADFGRALSWSASILGPVEVLSDHSKEHGDHESATCRLRTATGCAYLKIHHTRAHWNNEVHAYEHWAGVFGDFAPRLLAVHEGEPLALLISELPGQIVEDLPLPAAQQQAIWRAAGAALRPLHQLGVGESFGPCRRDGSCVEATTPEASEHVAARYQQQIELAIKRDLLTPAELATLRAAGELIPAFRGERPVPCHRDYCAANWLINDQGTWSGIIDFEFAYWEVRAADFSRDPNWNWLRRPDLMQAFFEGYGQPLTAREQQQLCVARAEYALGAILWGHANAFFGFEREGRQALAYLAGHIGP